MPIPDRPLIACSILDADHSQLGDEIASAVIAGVDMFTIDVMDGTLVPRITFGDYVVARVREWMELPMEVHLMVNNPERYIDPMADAGADLVTFHIETTPNCRELALRIRERGLLVGLALNVETPVKKVFEYLDIVDLVNVMAVPIGFGGQPLDPNVFARVGEVRTEVLRRGLKVLVEVDGGVKVTNIRDVAGSGADVITVGTGIYHSSDRPMAVRNLVDEVVAGSSNYDSSRLEVIATPRNLALNRSPEVVARLRALRDNLAIPESSWNPVGPPA